MLDALLDLVLPQLCAGCGGPGPWCAPCAEELTDAARHPLGRCRPQPVPAGFPRAAAAAAYDGAIRGALLAHKERGRLSLAGPLGAALAAAVGCLQTPRTVLLVPVPSSRAAVRERGHDHARRLAGAAAKALAQQGFWVSVAPLLGLARRTGDQAGLGAEQRAGNLAGAMRARSLDPRGRAVVVVDDLVTTGASLVEATRALAVAGLVVHGAATVAATARKTPHRL